MAARTRPAEPAAEPAELAELRAALQATSRIVANVAAKSARAPWTDFRQLLRDQYSTSPADVETFMDVLAGRKP